MPNRQSQTYHPDPARDWFHVSVVIPVYNAEQYVTRAVMSALDQPETAEVLIVEDGSTDGSLKLCRELESQFSSVVLLQHNGGANKGVSASRNLGIRSAKSPFLAFLDADDEYVEGRFENTKRVFAKYPGAVGVHEMIGVRYYNDELRSRHIDRITWEETGIRKNVNPVDLFRTLATGKFGHIHLDGLTLKSEVASNYKFDTSLRQSEDSDFLFQLSARELIYWGGSTHLVGLRGVHDSNSVFTTDVAIESRQRCLRKCIHHSFYGSTDTMANLYVIARYLKTFPMLRRLQPESLKKGIASIGSVVYLMLHPKVLVTVIGTLFQKRKPVQL